jgi:hypothetical protein
MSVYLISPGVAGKAVGEQSVLCADLAKRV